MSPHAAIGRSSIRSATIQVLGQGLQVLLMLLSAVVLARLLPPRDFGLFAMVVSLTALVGSLRGFGLHFAAVQAPTLAPEESSALFWVNLKLTTLSALFVAAMAPVLAWFYGQERLTTLTLVAAAGIFLNGTCVLHEALLMRRMRFDILQASELGSQIVSFLVAAGAAISGAGVWALVLQMLTYNGVRSATIWTLGRWLPARTERPAGVGPLLSFGRHYTAFFVLSSAARRIDRVLIGYFQNPTTLGFYDNAFRWSHHPVVQLYPPLQRVAVAGLSRLQSNVRAYAEATRRALLPLFSLVVPTLAYLAVEADFVIPTVLGERWRGAVPFFRVLCLGAMAASLAKTTNWLYLSTGDTRRQMHWSAISLPFLWLGSIVGIAWGAMGVAVGYTVAGWVLAYPGLAFCLRSSPLTMRDLLTTFGRPAAASAAAAGLLVALRMEADPGVAARGLLFAAAYLAVWRLLPGGQRGWRELLNLARRIPSALRGEREAVPAEG